MAEQQEVAKQEVAKQEVAKRKITLKNTHARGQRFVFDADGKQHLLGPGQEAEVELAEPQAKMLEDASKGGSDLHVKGSEPDKNRMRLSDDVPEQPEEHASRTALAAKERDEMEAGQEQDQDRRDKVEKMTGEELAAETGIHMHARGLKPEVVTSPPDAPPKKK